MIEELQMIKSIVGDLAGAGLWAMSAYIGYKLIINLVFYIGGGWLVHAIAKMIFNQFKADITRREANVIIETSRRKSSEIEILNKKHKSELDEVKSMYKILKEKKNVCSSDE